MLDNPELGIAPTPTAGRSAARRRTVRSPNWRSSTPTARDVAAIRGYWAPTRYNLHS
jgi:hypothetical protein